MGAMVAGVVVEPKRSTSLPFLSTRNLVKFLRCQLTDGLKQVQDVPLDRGRAGDTGGAGRVLRLEPREDLVHVGAVDLALYTSAHSKEA